MSKTNITKWTVIGGLAFSLLLAGCGNRMPANVPEPEEETPSANPSTPAAPASTAPSTAPAPVVTTPAYTAPQVGSLTVSGVEKSMSGLIFFKKMTVKGEVVNTSTVPCSGTLKIQFKDKKGIFTKTMVTEETKTVEISTLAPGAKQSFEVKSDDSGHDEAEVTVETRPAAAATAMGAPMTGAAYGAAAAYGAPVPGAAY